MEHTVAQSSMYRNVSYYLSLLIVAAGWLFLYRNDFDLIMLQWNSDDFSYCYLVPFITAYVVWDKRDAIMASRDNTRWPGFVGIIISSIFLLIGRLGSLETFAFFSMWLSIVSISLVLLGWKAWKQLLFPALILLFIVPPPGLIERTLSFHLRLISSDLSAQLLRLLSIPVFLEGNIIDLGMIKLQVVDACSGLRYFMPTILLSMVVGYALNNRLLSRILLVLFSAPITIALNTIRITITGILVRHISPTLADGFFHDFQGWIVYLASIAILAGCSSVMKRFEQQTPVAPSPAPDEVICEDAQPCPPLHPQRPLPPLLTGGLLFALAGVMSLFVMAQTIPTWKSLETFPLQIGDWKGSRSYIDQETLDNLWADDYFLASYTNTATGSTLNLLVPFYKTQRTHHTAHAPTSCLLGAGWEVTERTVLKPSMATGRTFPVQQLTLDKAGNRILSNFWFQQRGRILVGEFENKAYLFWDALTKHRTDGALVRVEMTIPQGKAVELAQAELDTFTAQVEKMLRAYLPD